MARKMLNVRLKDRIPNVITRYRIQMTDLAEYVTKTKWKWVEHIARMKCNTRTISSIDCQTTQRA